MTAAPATLLGRYIEIGEEMLSVADVSAFEVRASVVERAAERFRVAQATRARGIATSNASDAGQRDEYRNGMCMPPA